MPDEWRVSPGEWDEAVAAAFGPQLVVAGPGAGKTEFLVRRAAHLVDHEGLRPGELLMLSFSRRSAADLRSRVEARLARSFASLSASTFHSLAHRLLEMHAPQTLGWRRMPTLLTSPEHVALVAELLRGEDPDGWSPRYRDMIGTRTFAEEVRDFLLRCQEQLLSPADLEARGRADWRGLPGFFARYLAALRDRGRIDYGTLQAEAVALLDHADVLEAVAAQFRVILVDEYQDTTAAQASMLERLYRPHRNLTVAGDPYQSIYSFRGAELGNVGAFVDRFVDEDGRPARRLVLDTSFRVPRQILDAAVRITAGGDLPGAAGPVSPAPGDGAVETLVFDQQSHEAEWIATELQRTHLLEGIPYRRMAVLVRSKRRFLPELSRALDRRAIPHDRPDSRLADHAAVRLILDCVMAATAAPDERDAAMRRLLLGPLFALPLGALREVDAAAAHRSSWADAIEGLDGGPAVAALLRDPAWAEERPAADGFWQLWSTLPHLPRLVASPEAREERAAWSSLSQALGQLRERDPAATLADYLRWTEEEEFEAIPLLGYHAPDEDRLVLTTLHQAKGLEFDVVVIADATEGVFPDLRPRESLLGARHLSPSQPVEAAAYARFRLQEEMRLAYTAMGRARRRVVWTATSSGADQGEGSPSRFLAPAAGTTSVAAAAHAPAEPERSVVTPLEAEAWLRRMVRDPAAGEARRLAALNAIAAGSRWRMRPAEQYAGYRQRGADSGLIDADHILSPSQVDSYAACPRRYAFERRLRVGDRETVYSAFGNLIHDVLETAERGVLGTGRSHAGVEAALAALDERWDPAPYGGGAWAAAWRVHGERTLRHLYENWPSRGRPVALEHRLELDLDGVRWTGRADRIEVGPDGKITVVDYKTKKSAVTHKAAASSVQLAFYLLAARADPVITAHGEPGAAELWFPSDYKNGDEVPVRALRLDKLAEARQTMADAAAGIVAEHWPPAPGSQCDRCRVRLVCPAWPEGREAFAS